MKLTTDLKQLMTAFDAWPGPRELAELVPRETREIITYTIHALEGEYLLGLLYLASHLHTLQMDK